MSFHIAEISLVGGGTFRTSEGYTIQDAGKEWLVSWAQPVVYRTKSGHLTAQSVDVTLCVDPWDVAHSILGPVGAV